MLDTFPAHSVNLGTGENILNPALGDVLDLLDARGIRTSLTSNGLSLRTLDEARLKRLHDVELSVDFPTQLELDAFRGPGAWEQVMAALERCRGLGLEVTLLCVLMRTNWDRLAEIAALAGRLGVNFRVNTYQPVHGCSLMPSWTQFWHAWKQLFERSRLITCTEPVVAAVLEYGGDPRASRPALEPAPGSDKGCGATSIRVTPSGTLLPCVYWPRAAASLDQLDGLGALGVLNSPEFTDTARVPESCETCPLVARCRGGCPGRRALTRGVAERDLYCPYAGPEPVALAAQSGAHRELLHAANVCTTIVRG